MYIKNPCIDFISLLRSPAIFLAGSSLIVIATSRLAFALTGAFAILWVYTLSVIVMHCTKNFFPKTIFNNILSLILFSFVGSLYFLVLEILNPQLAIETSLVILLVPVVCFASGITSRTERLPLNEALYATLFEAISLAVFLAVFSLVREPLGYGSLSLPGGDGGITELFSVQDGNGFPVQIIAGAAGALLLLGYILFVFRLIKPEKEQSRPEGDSP